MDYATLNGKSTRMFRGEPIKDLLTLTAVIPARFEYSLYTVQEEHIARPDLISLSQYGSDEYTDIICKVNGISNPFELNVGRTIIIPSVSSLPMFRFSGDNIDSADPDDKKPVAKAKTEKRKVNDAVIGDKRYRIDRENQVVIY